LALLTIKPVNIKERIISKNGTKNQKFKNSNSKIYLAISMRTNKPSESIDIHPIITLNGYH